MLCQCPSIFALTVSSLVIGILWGQTTSGLQYIVEKSVFEKKHWLRYPSLLKFTHSQLKTKKKAKFSNNRKATFRTAMYPMDSKYWTQICYWLTCDVAHLPVTSAATWSKLHNFVSKVYKAFYKWSSNLRSTEWKPPPSFKVLSSLPHSALCTDSHVKNVRFIPSEEILWLVKSQWFITIWKP